ncbi:MAG TPA: hypothetical protein VK943_13335, partial [Arenibaculum sp.]|nr:hypothetical protein [Arenibaculum sp.]
MLVRRLKLSNLAFTLKFAIAPGVAVALMCVLAVVGSMGLATQVDQTRLIVERNLEGGIGLSETAARVQSVNGDLYRLMTDVAAGNELDVAGRIAVLQARVEAVVGALESHRDRHAAPGQEAEIDGVIAELRNSGEAVGFLAAMLEIDFASAVS